MSPAISETLVLASASKARARILAAAGISVTVDAAAIDESETKTAFRREGRDAAACAAALAEAKAMHAAARHPGELVIGCDQILDLEGVWFDKPRDPADLRRQLEILRGRQHDLVSAVAVVAGGAVLWRRVERARLAMRHFSDAFLADYLAVMGDQALAMPGGYALEGLGVQLFTEVEGDYFSILGLPLLPLLDFLRRRGALVQ